jgi:hypothetical protein
LQDTKKRNYLLRRRTAWAADAIWGEAGLELENSGEEGRPLRPDAIADGPAVREDAGAREEGGMLAGRICSAGSSRSPCRLAPTRRRRRRRRRTEHFSFCFSVQPGYPAPAARVCGEAADRRFQAVE